MKKLPPPISTVRARDLRRNATDAERRMWSLLKENFPEARFRRQVPMRHYIADFASHRAKLVIENDGGQHSADVDAKRTADIEVEGYQVIRFWNSEVLENPDGCYEILAQRLGQDHPHPAATRQQAAKSSHRWPTAAFGSPIKGEGA